MELQQEVLAQKTLVQAVVGEEIALVLLDLELTVVQV
jgi:hypothetical protein